MTSSKDSGPVLEAIAESAAKICDAFDALILLEEEGELAVCAHFGPIPLVSEPLPIRRDSVSGRAFLDRHPVHVRDILAEADDFPVGHAMAIRQGHRTALAVPLLHKGQAIGAIAIRRDLVEPFTRKQISILESFAAQAAMAIENARLLSEVDARNRELAATSNVLRTISQYPSNAQPAFEMIAQSVAELCRVRYSFVYHYDGTDLHLMAQHGLPPDVEQTVRRSFPLKPGRGHAGVRAILSGTVEQIPDAQNDSAYELGPLVRALGTGSVLAVPMLRNGTAIGAIALDRPERGLFPENQVELLKTFADQAVIAIENVRMFEDVRASNREMAEALAQQTATADVLKTISTSAFDLDAVLSTLVKSAAELCRAENNIILLRDGDVFRLAQQIGCTSEFLAYLRNNPLRAGPGTVGGRAAMSGSVVHVPDVLDDPNYSYVQGQQIGQYRTLLGVPLLRNGVVIGIFSLARYKVEPFSSREIDLVRTFADQAVIAIENVRLLDEEQARNRESTATGEILRVIAQSPTDIKPVLDAIAESAARICAAYDAIILLPEGDMLVLRAHHGPIQTFGLGTATPIGRDWAAGLAYLEGRPVHVEDMQAEAEQFPAGWEMATRHGHRTTLAVPLLRGDESLGSILLRRKEVLPFTQKQIDLLSTFADQAVIAIENVRLFDEEQARNRELTATSEVLNVISRSPTELQPVLDVILDTAVRLCEADGGTIARERDGQFVRSGTTGFSAEFEERIGHAPVEFTRGSVTGRTLVEGRVVHILDAKNDPEYTWTEALKFGLRTMLGVPLLREKRPVGVITLLRKTKRPFTERQIELVTTFADQAVIAIENVRLFEEVQARTRELTESLEHQTATSDVLNVISRSPSQIAPVFDTIVETAGRLCEADFACVLTLKDGLFHLAAGNNADRALIQHLKSNPIPLDRGSLTGRAALERRTIHVPDCLADPEYTLHDYQRVGNYRSIIGVPLLRDGEPIGAIGLMRTMVRPFNDKQIDLVTTFADQAVIAIENARLFDEVQARTAELARSVAELEALGEVSQAVNSTLDLEKVLETIVAKAVQLSGTDAGSIFVYSKSADRFRLKANYGMSPEFIAAVTSQAININDPGLGDAARKRAPVQVPDLAEIETSPAQRVVLEAGFRGLLYVPLLRPRRVIGTLVVRRRSPGLFSDATVKLMETFAAQSVLAIQNARLFSEVEEKGHEIELASRHKSQFLANMSHELRTPLNSVLGFTEMLVDGLYGELSDKAKVTLGRIQANGRHLLSLINDVLDLAKIEAGQLVMAMEDYSIHQIIKSIASTTEPLAQAKGLKLIATVADGLPLGRGDERRIAQVLLNLAGNAVKFTDHGSIEITAVARDGNFEVSVRDTGPGIAPENQARIFEEFQQIDDISTRTKGGTGLGLAISKRIIEMHGGQINVSSTVGAGSTFRFVIPVRAVETARAE